MRHRQRVLGAFVAACVGVATMVAGVVGASSASATASSRSTTSFLSGSTALNGVPLTQTSLAGGAGSTPRPDASIDWGPLTELTTQFDTDAVRQGRDVDPVDTVTRPVAGSLTANWSVGEVALTAPGFSFVLDIGTIGSGVTGTCGLRFSGAPYVCHLESPPQTIAGDRSSPGPYVDAKVVFDITVTPQALATLRTASVAGVPAGTANVALGEPSSTTDPLSVSCSTGAGGGLSYALGSLSTTPGLNVEANLQLQAGSSIPNPDPFDTDHPVISLPPLAQPSFAFAAVDTTIPMSGSGAKFDLGAVQADDRPMTADAGGPYTGTEGVPVAFDASGTTVGCGTPSFHWQFSDGGSADGAQPGHTFADNGSYTGTVTATEGARSDSASFTVTVANGAPSVDAGGNVSSPSGSAVSFAGTATDPSNIDQATLEYTWQFGDGS